MFYPKEILESRVIQDYLNGKTRNQIAIDNNISTGNVSNITNEWKRIIGKSDGEEIRDFVKLVKKSGLSVKQCADGFRIAQLMKKQASSMTMQMIRTTMKSLLLLSMKYT